MFHLNLRLLLLQNFRQGNCACSLIDLIAAPVVGFWNLRIQNGPIRPNVFSFLFSDLFLNQIGCQLDCIIQHIKRNAVTVPLRLVQYAVFAFAPCLDADIVLRQTAEHIFTLSDVNNVIVNADLVNARMLKLLCQTSAFQHVINAVFISFRGAMLHDYPPLKW